MSFLPKSQKSLAIKESAKKKSALDISVKEGSFSAVAQAVFDQFLVPFAVAINSTAAHIGFLRALPQLGSAIVQLFAPEIADYFSKKRAIVVGAVILQCVAWLSLILIAVYFRNPVFLIFVALMIGVFGGASNPIWSSWMGDLTDENDRASYFAKRNKINGIAAFGAIICFGFILQFFSERAMIFWGFIIVFCVALLARTVTVLLLVKTYEPAYQLDIKGRFSFIDFLRKLPESNFGTFVIFMALMSFGMNVASPFFGVYVLTELNYSYLQYTVFTLVGTFAAFMFVTYWGIRSDRVGNKITFMVTASTMPIMPLLWLLTDNFLLITLIQMFGNFVFVGFSLSATNFIYDAVSAEKRTRVIAYYNILNGLAVFLGASLGGLILSVISDPWFFRSNFHILFVVAALIRLAIVLSFFNKIKEVRQISYDVPTDDSKMFMRLVFTEPLGEGYYTALKVGERVREMSSYAKTVVERQIETIPGPNKFIRTTFEPMSPSFGLFGKHISALPEPGQLIRGTLIRKVKRIKTRPVKKPARQQRKKTKKEKMQR